ncbi:endonuclease/exonuclease/phosphatase family protein [soil metagenome]
MKIALEVFGGLLVLFSLLPLIKTHYWWVRIFDFPRTQIALLAFLFLGTYLWFFEPDQTLEWLYVFLLVGAILVQAIFVLPFTPLYKVEALASEKQVPQNHFSFMIANVRMTNTSYDSFLREVGRNDPDLLLINEPDNRWARALSGLDDIYPYQIKCPQDNTYGMMFFSKVKVVEHQIHYLVKEDIPSFYIVLQLNSGLHFDLFTVHPEPPRVGNDTDTREAELLIAGRMAQKTAYPSLVAGDLNDVAWSHTTRLFKRVSGLLDPRIGRGFFNTYNAKMPVFRYPLDHIFYHPSFRLVRLTRLPHINSDHFPMIVELNYEPT